MSAVRSQGISEGVLRSGALAYIEKPVSPEALRRSVISIFGDTL